MASVTVYTKSNCPQCDATKRVMKQIGVEYDEVSIEEDPKVLADLKERGFLAAPVVMTASGDAWAGFNEEKVRALAPDSATADDDWDF